MGIFRLELLSRLERYFFEIPPVLAPTQSPATRDLLQCPPDTFADGHAQEFKPALSQFREKEKSHRLRDGIFFLLELLSRLELPNLILTKDALYRLSYNSTLTTLMIISPFIDNCKHFFNKI